MIHKKFDQDWPTGLGDSIINIENIIHPQGRIPPKWLIQSVLNLNSSKTLCLSWLPASLMKIQSKMNVLAWRHHFPIISLWEIFRHSRALNSVESGLNWPKLELLWDFMPVLITCKFEKDLIKNNREMLLETSFLHYNQWVLFVAMEISSDLICPKTLCSLSPTPMMLHIKFDQDWPTSLRDIQVWKCGRRRMDCGPLLGPIL